AALNTLFPDHRVLTHTARFLLHPDNRLWAAITRLFHANLAHHSHRVGIQVLQNGARRLQQGGVRIGWTCKADTPCTAHMTPPSSASAR
ncbi:unnamed protein product, partial [Closterium sp. NIES-54]